MATQDPAGEGMTLRRRAASTRHPPWLAPSKDGEHGQPHQHRGEHADEGEQRLHRPVRSRLLVYR